MLQLVRKLQVRQLKKENNIMEEIVRYSDFEVELSASKVLHYMQCFESSPLYEEMEAEYKEIKEELISLGNPQALFCFGEMPEDGTPAVFALITEGNAISQYSTKMFEEGDCVKGMIADAVAGNYLFELEELALERLRIECGKRGLGILKRLEAPTDIPMETQKLIFEKCRAKEELGMNISSGFMFDPVKSSGIIFISTKDSSVFHAQHDCSKCNAKNCSMRKTSKIN